MAILRAYGFDEGDESAFVIVNGGSHAIETTDPRTGTRALRLSSSGVAALTHATLSFGTTLATGFVYFAFRPSVINSTTGAVLELMDGSTVHLRLSLRSDGKFELFRGPGTTSLATGTFVVVANQYTQCAVKWLIANASGTFDLRINGSATEDITFTGDTQNGAAAQVTQSKWYSPNQASSPNIRLDDVVVQDTTGSAPQNDWLGDVECMYKFPNGAGSENDFTVTGSAPAATAWESLDEVPTDDGVTVIESNTAGHKTLMTFEDIVNTAVTIFAVVPILRAQKASAASREVRSIAKLSGTTGNGATHTLSTSWANYQAVMPLDPGGSAWTGANFNSAEFGVEVVT